MIRGPLLRQPTAPARATFIDVLLPALPRANRAITKVSTNRSRECLCGEIECQVRVPARSVRIAYCRDAQCVPFLDAVIAKHLGTPLAHFVD